MSNHTAVERDKWRWITKHADTATVIGVVLAGLFWIGGEFKEVREDLAKVKTDMAVIKTVLMLKQILPCELAEGSK